MAWLDRRIPVHVAQSWGRVAVGLAWNAVAFEATAATLEALSRGGSFDPWLCLERGAEASGSLCSLARGLPGML